MPVFGDENQVCVKDENTVPASAYVTVISHEANYNECVQLRYSYRLYPEAAQRQALAQAFGCARVVFNDGLRARQEARKALERLLMEETKIDAAARLKIASQRKIIVEGSQEWDILYRKYYNDEVKKLGI